MNLVVVPVWGDVAKAAEKFPDDLILWRALNKNFVVAVHKELGKEMIEKLGSKGLFSYPLGRYLVSTMKRSEKDAIKLLCEQGFLDSKAEVKYWQRGK